MDSLFSFLQTIYTICEDYVIYSNVEEMQDETEDHEI